MHGMFSSARYGRAQYPYKCLLRSTHRPLCSLSVLALTAYARTRTRVVGLNFTSEVVVVDTRLTPQHTPQIHTHGHAEREAGRLSRFNFCSVRTEQKLN